jgi:RNA polymerase sigma-70 factor (ECF subfamily)
MAFTSLFGHFAPRLKNYLMKQGSTDNQAEELVQETMLNIWRKAKQFDPTKASASTWIYTIARNLKIDAFRRNKRPTINIEDVAEPVDSSDGADKKVDLTHRQGRIASALEILPPDQARVVKMSFYEDKSHGEISIELNIPLGTVKSRMRLAFERIRNFVGDTV